MPTADPPTLAAADSKLAGRLWILAAAVLWSCSGLFVKAGFFDDWPPAARGPLQAFWRAAFAAVFLLPMVRRPRPNWLLVPVTVCFTAMCVMYLSAMNLTTAANAIWLQYTSPWWVLLLSVALFGEPVVRRDLVALGFAALGVGTILWFEIRGQAQLGVVLGLASGACYAGVVVFMRRLRHENAAWLVALNHAVAAVAILPWVIYMDIWPSPRQLAVLAAFGIVQMAIPYLCLIRGLRSVSSQEAILIGLLEPVLIPVWLLLTGFETPEWWTVLGASMILLGLLLRYVVMEAFAANHDSPQRGGTRQPRAAVRPEGAAHDNPGQHPR